MCYVCVNKWVVDKTCVFFKEPLQKVENTQWEQEKKIYGIKTLKDMPDI